MVAKIGRWLHHSPTRLNAGKRCSFLPFPLSFVCFASHHRDPCERSAASLGKHNVYINARSRSSSPPWKRVQAISAHDGFHAKVDPSLGMLLDPSHAGVLGGLTSLQPLDTSKHHATLYFAIANGTSRPLPGNGVPSDQRYNLTLHKSINMGRSWTAQQLWVGYSGYTALAPLDAFNSAVAVFWETGVTEGCDLACGMTFGIIALKTDDSTVATTFYVGPNGTDNAMGTAMSPFATIERALTAFVLSKASSGSVLLLNGTYSVDRPVDITAAATANIDVAGGDRLKVSALHPGGATLSGGVIVKGWHRADGTSAGAGSQLWQAPLGAALRSFGRFPRFRQLFIDGRRANRSSFKLKNVWHATQKDLDHRNQGTTPEGPSYPAGDEAAFRLGLVTDDPSAADWPPGVIEAVFTGRLATHSDDPHHNLPWNEPRCPIERACAADLTAASIFAQQDRDHLGT